MVADPGRDNPDPDPTLETTGSDPREKPDLKKKNPDHDPTKSGSK